MILKSALNKGNLIASPTESGDIMSARHVSIDAVETP